MNRITSAFEHKKALIPFITCGDPDLEVTKECVIAMEKAGADLVELGIPFSDPTVEGPVIQGANIRALSGHVTTDKIFDMVRELRQEVTIPLVFMTYANVVFSYGIERFVRTCREAGIDGLILPDVPYEEKAEFADACAAQDVAFISLIAPTSHDRIKRIASEADGFVYCMSDTEDAAGEHFAADVADMVEKVKERKEIPCAVGVESSSQQQMRDAAAVSDGVILTTAVVELCGQHGRNCVEPVAELIRDRKKILSDL